jgi:DNA-binding LytR/AlgR family response regulator
MTIKCIAVDDELLALNKIRRYVEKVEFLDFAGSFSNALEAIQFIREHPVDLVFLDIQMDELTGIQMLRSMKNSPMVIFTTAYEQYAVEGYELDVIDYLLKPIPFDRFVKACEKALNRYHLRQPAKRSGDIQKAGNDFRYIFVKSGTRIMRIKLDEILFIEGLKDYLLIHTAKERVITLQTFAKMLQALPEKQFIRVHKSYIIALDKIDRVERNIIFIGEKRIPVGVTYKSLFQKITGGLIR